MYEQARGVHEEGIHTLISMLSTPPSRESDAVRASLIVRWTLDMVSNFIEIPLGNATYSSSSTGGRLPRSLADFVTDGRGVEGADNSDSCDAPKVWPRSGLLTSASAPRMSTPPFFLPSLRPPDLKAGFEVVMVWGAENSVGIKQQDQRQDTHLAKQEPAMVLHSAGRGNILDDRV